MLHALTWVLLLCSSRKATDDQGNAKLKASRRKSGKDAKEYERLFSSGHDWFPYYPVEAVFHKAPASDRFFDILHRATAAKTNVSVHFLSWIDHGTSKVMFPGVQVESNVRVQCAVAKLNLPSLCPCVTPDCHPFVSLFCRWIWSACSSPECR
jgi:hypothetical protein